MRTFLIALAIFCLSADAQACPDGELKFNLKNLEITKAFAIIADFAQLKLDIDKTITHSSPIKFDCTPWEIVAQNLANRYNLNLVISNGVMHVTKN